MTMGNAGRHSQLLRLVCAGLLLAATNAIWADRAPSAESVLTLSLKNSQLLPYKMECVAKAVMTSGVGTTQEQNGRVVAYRDGDRSDYRSNMFEKSEEKGFKSRQVFDGKIMVIRQGHGEIYPKYLVSENSVSQKQHNRMSYAGDFLDRFALKGGDLIVASVLACAQKELQPRMEPVGGSGCYVITADSTDMGHVTLWIDPAHDYRYRKLVIQKKPGNEYFDDTKLPFKWPQGGLELTEVVFEVQVDSFQMIERVAVASEGSMKETRTFSDGSVTTIEYRAKRKNIEFHPDFKRDGAFVIDIPSGTKVLSMDGPASQPPRWRVWQDGKATVDIDQEIRETMDDLGGPMEATRPPRK